MNALARLEEGHNLNVQILRFSTFQELQGEDRLLLSISSLKYTVNVTMRIRSWECSAVRCDLTWSGIGSRLW
jgi:hypothetical protein